VKTILKKEKPKNKARDITLSDFRLYYKATIFKTVRHCSPPPPAPNRYIDQYNR